MKKTLILNILLVSTSQLFAGSTVSAQKKVQMIPNQKPKIKKSMQDHLLYLLDHAQVRTV